MAINASNQLNSTKGKLMATDDTFGTQADLDNILGLPKAPATEAVTPATRRVPKLIALFRRPLRGVTPTGPAPSYGPATHTHDKDAPVAIDSPDDSLGTWGDQLNTATAMLAAQFVAMYESARPAIRDHIAGEIAGRLLAGEDPEDLLWALHATVRLLKRPATP